MTYEEHVTEVEKLAALAAKRTCWSLDSPQRVFQYGWEAGYLEGHRAGLLVPCPDCTMNRKEIK